MATQINKKENLNENNNEDIERIARKAKRMAKITNMSEMTWFRYLVANKVD